MSRSKTPSFVTEIPLRVTPAQERDLNVRLEAARQVYNACLSESLRRLALMRQSRAYQQARQLPARTTARRQAFQAANRTFGFQEFDLITWAKQFGHSWLGPHLDAQVIQVLASRAFQVAHRYALGQQGHPRFVRKDRFDSVEGKNNRSGIRWQRHHLVWRDLRVPGILDPADPVLAHGLAHRIKYVRLVRRPVKGRPRFYVQLVNEGVPYRRLQAPTGTETIGIDPGPQVFALAGDTWAARVDLAHKADQAAIRRLQRHIDRCRRANNPHNYLPDGRIKPGLKQWVISQNQRRAEARLVEYWRKAAATRHTQHGTLINLLLRRAVVIQIEKNAYRSFHRQFGRAVGNAAPGTFTAELVRKATALGITVHQLPTILRLSQTCHGCGTLQKKLLSLRVHHCACGIGPVQRDVYSAWLARFATASVGPQGLVWHLDAAQAQTAWAAAESRLSAASGLLTVAAFTATASQPAT